MNRDTAPMTDALDKPRKGRTFHNPGPAAANPPTAKSNWKATPGVRPTPLPKRPKGRFFVGSILLAICGFGVYSVWNAFLRYQAFGVIEGRVIHVSPNADGVIQSLHVREGDLVRQGQLLVTFDNRELSHQLARLGDELRVAQASLDAAVAQLRFQSQMRGDHGRKAIAEHYELWGQLLHERAELDKLVADRARLESLGDRGRVAPAELDAIRFAEAGRKAKVEKLTAAVDELKKRAELVDEVDAESLDPVKPQLVRIETMQAELTRLRERIEAGSVRSPVNGRVIKMRRFTGEYADVSDTVLEVLEDGSLEIVVYLPQQNADWLNPGDKLNVRIDPNGDSLPCVVQREGDQLEPAPKNLQRFYRDHEKLLPVHLLPQQALVGEWTLRLGTVVSVPWGRKQPGGQWAVSSDPRTADLCIQ